jgi:hypothetical protein
MDDRLGSSGFAEFDRLREIFRRTRTLLDAVLTTGDLPDGGSDVLATEALPHIEDVEAGFRTWLRASQAELAVLRALVLQAGLGSSASQNAAEERAERAESLQARAAGIGEREILPAPAQRLAALEHARLVFALLPRTPAADVRYPGGRRSYADIPAPRTAAELAERIEELEREIWWVATGRPPRRADEAYRRTYGFFDAAERLTTQGFNLAG